MSHNATGRITIGLYVLFAVAASNSCFAQWGSNAPAGSDCCPCVPNRPWGYCQTRWHQWPGVMYGAPTQVKAPTRGEGISPPQTELPTPGSEGEAKPSPYATQAPSETKPSETKPGETKPQKGPAEAPANPFVPSTQPPAETAPEKAPEKTEPGEKGPATTEPGTNGPGMEMPGTEPPKETPSAPADTTQPAPGESSAPAPSDSNESKPQEQPSLEPESGKKPAESMPGGSTMSPGVRLRRGETSGVGRRVRESDPAPVMPIACNAPAKEAAPSAPRAKAMTHEMVQAAPSKAAPELIVPAMNAQRIEAAKVEPQDRRSLGDNPLRAEGVKPSSYITEEPQKQNAEQPFSRDSSTMFTGTNPLR